MPYRWVFVFFLILCSASRNRAAWSPCVPYNSYDVNDDLVVALPTTLSMRPENQRWSAGFRLTSIAKEWRFDFDTRDGKTDIHLVVIGSDAAAFRRPFDSFSVGMWTEVSINVTFEDILRINVTAGDESFSIVDSTGSGCWKAILRVEHLTRVIMARDCPPRCVGEKVTSEDGSQIKRDLERKTNVIHILNRGDYDLSVALVFSDCVHAKQTTEVKKFGKNDFHLDPRSWNKVTIEYVSDQYHGVSIAVNDRKDLRSFWPRKVFTCHSFVKFEIQTSEITFWSFGCADAYYKSDGAGKPPSCPTGASSQQTSKAPSSPSPTEEPDSRTASAHDAEPFGQTTILIHLAFVSGTCFITALLGIYSLWLSVKNVHLSGLM